MKWWQQAGGVTYLGVAINLLIGTAKLCGGWRWNSKALMADGVHSLVDLSSDLAVLIGLRMAAIPGDRNHLYGHHKFASMAQVIIALMIFLFSLSLIANAAIGFDKPAMSGPGLGALYLALVSIAVKEGLFWQTWRVARRERSRLVMANAWHHRTDSISSLVTATAIGAAYWGGEEWWFLDRIMAIGLGGFLALEGGRMLWRGLSDLLDQAPEGRLLNELQAHILPTDGAIAYHHFRARRIGDMIEVDLHLQVDPLITVEEGHQIARQVRDNIRAAQPEVLDVLIHIEPATPEHLRKSGISEVP